MNTTRDEHLQAVLRQVVADQTVEKPDLTVSFQLVGANDVIADLQPQVPHYAASTMKLPLIVAAYRLRDHGILDLDSKVTVHNNFRSQAGGQFGIEADEDSDQQVWDQMGQPVTLRWLCRRSIIRSSNLATNLVLDAVGLDAVAQAIRICNADGVQVVRGIEDYAARQDGRTNLVTVDGLNQMLRALSDRTAARPDTCDELLDVLADNEMDTDVRSGLPAGTWVAHKNGWVSDAVLDAALVRPSGVSDRTGEFALTVAISGQWGDEKMHAVVREIAAAVWRHRS